MTPAEHFRKQSKRMKVNGYITGILATISGISLPVWVLVQNMSFFFAAFYTVCLLVIAISLASATINFFNASRSYARAAQTWGDLYERFDLT